MARARPAEADPYDRPPARRRRRSVFRARLVLVPLLIGVLAVGYGAYWNWMAGVIRGGFEAFLEDFRRVRGEVALGSFQVDGFPFGFRARATGYALDAPNGMLLTGPDLVAKAPPWSYANVTFEMPAGQRLVVPMAPGLDVTIEAESGDGQVRLTEGSVLDWVAKLLRQERQSGVGGFAGADLRLRNIAATDTQAGFAVRARRLELSADQPAIATEGRDPRAYALHAELLDVALPAAPLAGFGAEVDRAALALGVLGELPQRLSAARLALWRDDGGRVEVEELALDYGALHLTVDGSLTLDQELRPAGDLVARVTGWPETVDALVAQRVIGEGEAQGLKLALTLLSGPPDAAGAVTATVPLRLADGGVSAGPLTLPGVTLPSLLDLLDLPPA